MALQANFLVEEIMLENPWRRIKRRTQQKRRWVVRLQAWYTEPRAANATHGSRFAALRRSSLSCHAHSHTCFAIFNSFFPTDFRGKKRGCWQPIEDIEVDNIWLLSWSLGASEQRLCRWNFPGPWTWFSARLSSKVLSLVWFYFQEAIVVTSFLPRVRCLQFQSNSFTFLTFTFSFIVIKHWDTDF